MIRAIAGIVFSVLINSCVNPNEDMPETIISLREFQSICSLENKTASMCEALHNRRIVFEGELYYPEEKWTAEVLPRGVAVPIDGDDLLWDKISDDEFDQAITLRVPKTEKSLESMSRLHQKSVTVSGRINTECLTGHREAYSEMEELNNNDNPDDDVIIMLTGFCHYYREYIDNFEIEEIIK